MKSKEFTRACAGIYLVLFKNESLTLILTMISDKHQILCSLTAMIHVRLSLHFYFIKKLQVIITFKLHIHMIFLLHTIILSNTFTSPASLNDKDLGFAQQSRTVAVVK